MTDNSKQFDKETFLRTRAQGAEVLSTVGEQPRDTLVRVVVRHPQRDEPMIACAEIMAPNHDFEYGGVLTRCGPGFTEFPLSEPCLAFTPPLKVPDDDGNIAYGYR